MDLLHTFKNSVNHTLAAIYRNWGETFAERQDNAHAISLYTRAIRLNPEDVESYLHRGIARMQAADYDAAIQDFNAALSHAYAVHHKVDALLWRGLVAYYMGDAETAIADYNMALYLQPAHSMAYVYRGMAELTTDNPTAALSDFNAAIRNDPDNFIAYRHRANVREKLGRLRDALSDYHEYLERGTMHNAHLTTQVESRMNALRKQLQAA